MLHRFKLETLWNTIHDDGKDEKPDWVLNIEIKIVSWSEEDYADNLYLDINEIDHSNLDISLPIKTNKSEEDKKHGAKWCFQQVLLQIKCYYWIDWKGFIQQSSWKTTGTREPVPATLQEGWCSGWIDIGRSQIQQCWKVLPGHLHQEPANCSPALFYPIWWKGKSFQREFLPHTLDVLLDNKHEYMTKMRKDTENALDQLRFEEILGVICKHDPFLAWISIKSSVHSQVFISWSNWTISRL